jgi:Family of unknown function (DUF6335)
MTTPVKTPSRRKPHRSLARTAGRALRPAVLFRDPPSEDSLTALTVGALRAGIVVSRRLVRPPSIPCDADILCGDPDDETLANEYVGDETPGGSASTPDQNDVDEIGRVYGVQEEDSGELRTSAELLAGRDRHRAELLPTSRRSRT